MELASRAARVFPGGKHTRLPLQAVPGPQFLSHGDGCRVVDSEGRTWIDYLAGFGANVLGYNHRRVEAAASEAARRGATLTGPTELSVALAERLVSLRPAADWVLLAKNGSDVTTAARVVARAATGRRRVLRERARVGGGAGGEYWAYHGSSPGWTRGRPGVLAEEGAALEEAYEYNDLASVEAALARLDGDCAAIFVGGASYPYSAPTREPTAEFARGVRALADAHGALLVLDEIRTNFRVGRGVAPGHWAELCAAGAASAGGGADAAAAALAPDLHCMCKALSNGHPLSALVGGDRARDAAASITWTGTFWLSPGPMAAALTTLDELAADDGAAMRHMQAMGAALAEGLRAQALDHRVRARVTGAAAMPLLTFDADAAPERARAMTFCAAAAERGVWLHPYHNWYLTAAHTPADIAQTLEATNAAFAAVVQAHGQCGS